MPVHVRCNGVFDCPYHQDEEGCDTYQWPGFYRCRGSKVCLHPLHVCDGVKRCPQHEWFCAMTCPRGCSCAGLSFTCPHVSAGGVPGCTLPGCRREWVVSWTSVEQQHAGVSLAACRLKQLALPLLPNVKILDASNNIESATVDALKNVSNLNQLLFSSNPLTSLFTSNVLTSTLTFPKLRHIDLSLATMDHLNTSRLKPFSGLITLNFSGTSVQRISGDGLSNLDLAVLDLTGCNMEEFPPTLLKNLSQLTDVRGDNPKLCCEQILPAGFDTRSCQAPRFIVSCENLLGSYTQRVVVAIIAAATLFGNSAVLLRAFWWRKTKDRVTLFVLQLCMSKCLKGVYLCALSVVDNVFSGSYLWRDREWKTGVWCQVLAFLLQLSTQVCVFLHFSMTMDRYLATAWSHTAWTARLTMPLCVLCWCGGLVQACMTFWWRDFRLVFVPLYPYQVTSGVGIPMHPDFWSFWMCLRCCWQAQVRSISTGRLAVTPWLSLLTIISHMTWPQPGAWSMWSSQTVCWILVALGPHGLAFTRRGCFSTKLAHSFLSHLCPSAYRNLSPVLLFTHQLLPTYLQFSSSDWPLCLHRPFTYISLLYKPSFCHFSFSLWSTRHPARWPCAATRVVGGWDPGDWGHCWAAAPQYQHITSARTSARREVRKARPDQSVGGTSLVGVFHRGQSGVSSPWVYFIRSPGVTSLDIRRENWHPLVGLGGGWGVDKMKW